MLRETVLLGICFKKLKKIKNKQPQFKKGCTAVA